MIVTGSFWKKISAGKLAYEVDRARHAILLNISNVAQSDDYYVRLCHQRFVCEDVGSASLVSTYYVLNLFIEMIYISQWSSSCGLGPQVGCRAPSSGSVAPTELPFLLCLGSTS